MARHQSLRSMRRARRRPGLSLPIRVTALAVLTLATAFAVFLVWPRPPTTSAAQRVQIDMGGFRPAIISARAGEPIRLHIVNPDSQFHTDGGGWHQLAIPELGMDANVAPRSDKIIEIPAAAPGEYAFYCDVCCGGKENLSMQGVLKVSA